MKYFIGTALLFLMLFNKTANAQSVKDSLETLLQQKRFTFVANSMDPLRGSTRFLTGAYYDVTPRNDSLISYLPYIGRSTMAPMTAGDNGIMFSTTEYSYAITPRKRSGWNIQINVRDQAMLSRFNLVVFSDGTATLSTTSNFRDPVSFRGYIRELRKDK